MIGKLLGNRYEILEQLGGGGMALVWKGKDTFLNRLVTIKVLRPEYASDQDFVRRFRREAQAVASLSHPNIVSIYDVGQENGSHYLVMEYVDGESLKELIRREAPLSPTRVIQLGRQIAEALEHAHENNIIHRDVKPHNILITRSGRAKLTDFGIAQASASTLTHTDTIVGSVHYISPEQARGEPAGPKSDIYALGVVLYEMLTGQVPYQGDGAIGVALKHIQEQPLSLREINPGVPEDLEKVVLRAMDKIPERRHKSARALGEDLVSISEETKNMAPYDQEDEHTRVLPGPGLIKEEAKARAAGTPHAPAKRKGLKPAAWGMLALLVVLLIGGALFALNSYLNVAEAEVPPVVGIKREDAERILKERGFNHITVNERFDEKVEKGVVILQDPKAHEKIKTTRTILLVVSKGPDLVEVPDVIGRYFDEAKLTLENEGFLVEAPQPVYSKDIEADKIAAQEPAGKTKAPRGSRIKLFISKGPEPAVQKVPNLVGLTQEAARAELNKVGLELGDVISQAESFDYLSGQIIAHQPGAGEEVEQGTRVNIILSKGPGPAARDVTVRITVPDDGQTHEVKIETEDVRGKYYPYISTHQPGDHVAKSIRLYGKGKVRVYMDGNLVDEKDV
ncbi:Stk1 family PASTA domain-containing Ser/Thr kinase [Desulforamulus putei]|uniref:non-specific serine/threonine protein kinase n=1 Tax=Desulforamulus putei DSM 12395 TaxID=1121429 RepID=A0A1M4SV34_9FIRM|nr:Stk1 family PASTA domain-containing Ser/Thr kinase [Desulforamulus putei]SHE36053.1 serine/threonine protein kinase [Desulforamulus putei DSM 12395]